uniref:Secreted protein n=1 Tax=Ixodes ricinus TaxID=34613 RepID=A0A6B0UZL6_IXORI
MSAAMPLKILLMRMGILFSLPPLMLIPRPLLSCLTTRTMRLVLAMLSGMSLNSPSESVPLLLLFGASYVSSKHRLRWSSSSVARTLCHCCLAYTSSRPVRVYDVVAAILWLDQPRLCRWSRYVRRVGPAGPLCSGQRRKNIGGGGDVYRGHPSIRPIRRHGWRNANNCTLYKRG